MKLRCLAPAMVAVRPGRARSSTVAHPPKVIAFSASNQASSRCHALGDGVGRCDVELPVLGEHL